MDVVLVLIILFAIYFLITAGVFILILCKAIHKDRVDEELRKIKRDREREREEKENGKTK